MQVRRSWRGKRWAGVRWPPNTDPRATSAGRRACPEGRLEDVDDEHATAAAWTGWSWVGWLVRCAVALITGTARSSRARATFGLAASVGEQTVVADAMETSRQDGQQKASDELVGMGPHGAMAAFMLSAASARRPGHKACARDVGMETPRLLGQQPTGGRVNSRWFPVPDLNLRTLFAQWYGRDYAR